MDSPTPKTTPWMFPQWKRALFWSSDCPFAAASPPRLLLALPRPSASTSLVGASETSSPQEKHSFRLHFGHDLRMMERRWAR